MNVALFMQKIVFFSSAFWSTFDSIRNIALSIAKNQEKLVWIIMLWNNGLESFDS